MEQVSEIPERLLEDKSKRVGLRLVFSLFFIFIVVLSVFASTFVTYNKARELIRDEIRARLIAAAGTAALSIDAEKHARITFDKKPKKADVEALHKHLQRIQKSIPDARFVYTFRLNSKNQVAFVGDSDDGENKSEIGEVFTDETPTMRSVFLPGASAAAETEVATDRWGTWLSGYAPLVRKNGTVEGIVGIDISAAQVNELEKRYLAVGLGSSVVVILILFPFLLLISRALTSPLLKAVSELQRIKNFDLNGSVRIRTLIREMNDLRNALESTRIGLRSFRKYIPNSLATEVLTQNHEATAGAKKREITLLFTDFENFTTFSESASPDDLVQLLNQYFEAISLSVSEHMGTVDKFIGDSVMAFWNAPETVVNHPEQACLSAFQILERIRAINVQRNALGQVGLNIRIGVHTGIAMVGNVGHEGRLNYTAMGDAVNMASRLENLNKKYNTNILISGSTAERLGANFKTQHIDNVVLKGKTRPVAVFELLGVDSMGSA